MSTTINLGADVLKVDFEDTYFPFGADEFQMNARADLFDDAVRALRINSEYAAANYTSRSYIVHQAYRFEVQWNSNEQRLTVYRYTSNSNSQLVPITNNNNSNFTPSLNLSSSTSPSGVSNVNSDLSGWTYNGHYWDGPDGWSFYPNKGQIRDKHLQIVNDKTLVAELMELESGRQSNAKKETSSLSSSIASIRHDISRNAREREGTRVETEFDLGEKWSPGVKKDGRLNAIEHWRKHADVDGRSHKAAGFGEQDILQATISYVDHAYEFVRRHQANKFTQKSFIGDGGEPKNVTIYFSHNSSTDAATIAVVDQDMNVMRSFYDLEPSKHGYSNNREWLKANGANL